MVLNPDTKLVLTHGSGYITFPEDEEIGPRYRGKTFYFVIEFPNRGNPTLELDGVRLRGCMKENAINSILEQQPNLIFAEYTTII